MFDNLTVAKIIAYILVTFAFVMLVRYAIEKTNETFDVGEEVQKMCQPNLAPPCHYREVRGENVSTGDRACHYAWDAPALFGHQVTLNSRKQVEFCDSMETTDDSDLKGDSCNKTTLDSVWTSFTNLVHNSIDALSEKVGQKEPNETGLYREVLQTKRNVESAQEQLNQMEGPTEEAQQNLNQSSETCATTANRIQQIETHLRSQRQCDLDLKDEKQKNAVLEQSNALSTERISELERENQQLRDANQSTSNSTEMFTSQFV